MSRIVKVNQGDYEVQNESGGNIIFNPTAPGQVIILGNLDVKGTTTTIESTNLNAGINIFSINTGLNTPGIPSALYYQSGMSIGRGTYNAAEILFDESVTHYDPTTAITATGATGNGTTVTLTFSPQASIPFPTGTQIVVAGFTPTGYNGTYTSTGGTSSSVSFANTTVSAVSVYGTITANVTGTFVLRTANTNATPATNAVLNGLQLRTLTGDGTNNLVIDLKQGTPTLRLANSTSSGGTPYTQRAINSDDIVTVGWVQNYIASSWLPSSPGVQGTATVQTIQYPVSVPIGSANSAIQATASNVIIQASGTTITAVSSTGLLTGNVNILADTVSNTTNNLILSANTNKIEVTGMLDLDNQISSVTGTAATASSGTATITFASQLVKPFGVNSSITVTGFTPSNFNGTFTVTACTTTSVSYALAGAYTGTVFGTISQTIAYTANKSKIYSSGTIGPGRTGIYLTNSTVTTPDELISRNRAVLLSILL